MGILGKIKKFGDFGNRFEKFSDIDLIKAFQGGNEDALAEYVNRYANDFETRSALTSGLGTGLKFGPVRNNLGDTWLKYRKWASEFDPSKGMSPRTWFSHKAQWDLQDAKRNALINKTSNPVLESQCGVSNPMFRESDVDANSALDALSQAFDYNGEVDDRTADIMEAYKLLRKNTDEVGQGIIDGYENAIAKRDKEFPDRFENSIDKAANRYNSENYAENLSSGASLDSYSLHQARSLERNPAPNMSDVANEIGTTRPGAYIRTQKMVDRLPKKVREEVLRVLRRNK